MLLPAGGDVGVQPPVFAGFEVGGAAVARIRNEGIRQLPSVRLDSLEHRQQVNRIARLVAHANRHDDFDDRHLRRPGRCTPESSRPLP